MNRPQLVVSTTTATDTTPPSAPTLTATATSSSEVSLQWTASTDSVGVAGYEVQRDGVTVAKVDAATTSYQDTKLAPNVTYSYVVRAFDAAGNVAPSNTAKVTTPAGPAPPGTFAAVADARVQESTPTQNFGTSYLRIDGGSDPDVESYLRFDVSGAGTVTRAVLRLYATNGSGNGPAVYGVADNSWTESGITWNTRPAHAATATDDKGSIAVNTWVEYDVTPLVTGNGTVSFALIGASSDGTDFSSREASTNAPQLVLTTAP